MVTEEKPDNQAVFKKFFIFCGIFLVLLFALEIYSGQFMQEKLIPDNAWTISLNGEEISSAPGRMLPHALKQNETLICSAIIPDYGFSYPALVFEATKATITVSNAGKQLYSSESKTSADPSSKLLNQISLKNTDPAQPVIITITAGESNSIFSVPNFSLVEQRNGFQLFIKARVFTFVIALFLFFLGIIGTVICSASRFLGKKLLPLISISQFALWTSLCMFCHLGFILVFIQNEIVCSILELISLYLALYFILLTVFPKLLTTKKQDNIFKKAMYIYLGCCLVSLILPFFTGMSIMAPFSVMIIILVAAAVYTVYLCLKQWLSVPEKVSFSVAGFLALVVFTLAEQLRLVLFTTGIPIFNTPEMIILSFGLLIYTVCALIDYFTWFKNSTIQETVEESWKRFSQPNSKAGISGFQKTMALLQELQNANTQYTIITISIDNMEELKLNVIPFLTLEDNFARLLHTVFSSYGITGNLGQGKFIAALPDIPEGKTKQLIRAFKELVKRDNSNHPEAVIVFSVGYALSSDSEEPEVVKICKLADNSRQVDAQKLLN